MTNDPTSNASLSHVDQQGQARMVDVGDKPATERIAEAQGIVRMRPETASEIAANAAKKGDVLAVARIAGIQAAKRTDELIPLCHSIPLSSVEVSFDLNESAGLLTVRSRARTTGPTGVEMEALTAVAVAALTVYDMCKSVDRAMGIDGIHLTLKSGGRSGTYRSSDTP